MYFIRDRVGMSVNCRVLAAPPHCWRTRFLLSSEVRGATGVFYHAAVRFEDSKCNVKLSHSIVLHVVDAGV